MAGFKKNTFIENEKPLSNLKYEVESKDGDFRTVEAASMHIEEGRLLFYSVDGKLIQSFASYYSVGLVD